MTGTVIYFDLGNTLVFGTAPNVQPFAGAASTIEELWWRGYAIGLLSDQPVGTTHQAVRDKLDAYGLDASKFDFITLSSDLTPPAYKPAPAIFAAAVTNAGHATASSRTVFITEDLSHVTAARALDWRAIHKPYEMPCTPDSGECIAHLDELLTLFPALSVDLYLRDAVGDPGDDNFVGPVFWNSPDLWIRHHDDGDESHQQPRAGGDNYFHARIRNRGSAVARQFSAQFTVREWAGTQFVYPGDWSPVHGNVSGEGLWPDDSTVLVARWQAADVPVAGTHACWLAAVQVHNDLPAGSAHVWRHNNLAQKNLTVMDAPSGGAGELDLVVGSRMFDLARTIELEVIPHFMGTPLTVSLIGRDGTRVESLLRHAFGRGELPRPRLEPERIMRFLDRTRVVIEDGSEHLDIELGEGSRLTFATRTPDDAAADRSTLRQPGRAEVVWLVDDATPCGDASVVFNAHQPSSIHLGLAARQLARLTLRVVIPKKAPIGDDVTLDIVQRDLNGQVVGGITIAVRVAKTGRSRPSPRSKRRPTSAPKATAAQPRPTSPTATSVTTRSSRSVAD